MTVLKDTFSTLHPVLNFLYFAGVITLTMLSMHPVLLLISLVCGLLYALYLGGAKTLKFCLYLLSVFLLIALVNPLFNPAGQTVLFRLSGRPVTWESLLYGLCSAAAFAAVLIWFSCCNTVMTSDKSLFIFGRILPSVSLILAMIFRLVPRYRRQTAAIARAQKGIGKDPAAGSLAARVKSALAVFSMLFTWALESAIDTADSMRSRGYGTGRRTHFACYRFDKRDALFGACMLLLFAVMVSGAVMGAYGARYFPGLQIAPVTPSRMPPYAACGLFFLLPMLLNIKEDLKWRRLQSKI